MMVGEKRLSRVVPEIQECMTISTSTRILMIQAKAEKRFEISEYKGRCRNSCG
jgi:hypothetical protein